MSTRYETVFILTPVLSDDQVKEAVTNVKDFLKKNGATVKHQSSWGLKKLAYPIQNKSTGFYQLFEFEADGDFISKFELELKRDERMLRFLTVKMNKNHIEFAEKQRNKAAEASN
ncbi:30S ribosomal protein S6 [Salibacter sp.]|uniref:30S ribosomal protein S6 n=1 Tax=Salibacter sp. TaxID=2010995 RepID=UPI00286FE46E|nr:30S ribosomal protein S6 [Salibacter sp.]MDR9397551.1 30S ribosomal protein S6 [Salibacter sp.]MDR9486967.1 30S ribosomal protein S6 [Salibacter sp.]